MRSEVPSIAPSPIANAPPHFKNFSFGEYQATEPSAPIVTAVAKSASK